MYPPRIKILLALTVLTISVVYGTLAVHHKHYHRAPIIDLSGAEELIGTIREDQKIVTVTPHLHILKDSGPVCRYELTPVAGTKELPFEVDVLDNALGTAQIHLRDGADIDCSDVEFRMHLVAVRCADDSAKSEPVTLKVVIQDVNNHAPEFDAPWYTFDVEEGRSLEVTRLFAIDKDCGHPYGKVCRYEITNPPENNPFQIDDQGVLSITKPLNRSQAESHILTIVAHDCGMLRSKSTLVTVHVKSRCVDGIRNKVHGTNEPLAVELGDESRKRAFEGAEIVTCSDTCKVKSAEVLVKLQKNEKGKKSVTERIHECEINPATTELLKDGSQSEASEDEFDEDDEDDVTSEGASSSATTFDGKKTSVTVSTSTVKKVIPEKFTFYFSMKTERGSEEEQKLKQNILCETDKNGLNRHHFAVYIRHCKLELLLRREPEKADSDFQAAEWRWSDGRVCDGNWHNYAIIFSDLDRVQLLVDGELFNSTERNPEILDDWPLHEHNDKNTRLVIGACWHGRSQKMVQFFKGQLASMYMLTGNTEQQSKIECLYKKAERVHFESTGQLASGETASFNNDHTELRLKANSLEDLSLLLQEVEFSIANRKPAAAIGTYSLSASGIMSCQPDAGNKNAAFNRSIPSIEREIKVNVKTVSPKISISITGQSILNSDRKNLKAGAFLLPDVQITITEETKPPVDVSKDHKLDWCTVHMSPPRDMDLEFFSSPATLMASMNVDFVHDKQGIMLKGRETAGNYAKVLTKIHYFNTRPESYQKRMYKLQCKGENVTSNEFVVTMDIDSSEELKEAVEKLASLTKKIEGNSQVDSTEAENNDPLDRMVKHFEPSFDQMGANRLQNILEMDLPRPKALHGYDTNQTSSIAGGAVVIVVAICGILLVLLVVGVVKMRDDPILQRRRSRRDSFEWDDNGLNMNLTLNPLERMNKGDGIVPTDIYNTVDEVDGEESCSDDDGSYRDDEVSDEDEEEGGEMLPLKENGRQDLEWDDDATLDNNNVKSYRV